MQAEGQFGTCRVGEARNPGPQRPIVSASATSMFNSIDNIPGMQGDLVSLQEHGATSDNMKAAQHMLVARNTHLACLTCHS